MLVLVVGPSGAGKDTVLGLARQALAERTWIRFVRRVITRPAEAGHEDHDAVTEAEFALRHYALQWQAHGLHYGIPADILDDIELGHVVVANVSRGVIAEAAARFPAEVVRITAPPAILAARLSARGREAASDIAARLAREVAVPTGVPVETIVNDGTPQEAAAQLLAFLHAVADRPQPARP